MAAEASSEYLTIEGPSEAVFREKMSRFLAFASPVDTEEQARAWIASVANKYHDARHVCWAFMLGADCSRFLSSDNGEPSGTAGKPILGQIRSAGLTNVAVAVVRYFGGIKLGTSGLIVAYREAARLALEAAAKVSRCEESTLGVTFPYLVMNSVMKLLKEADGRIIAQQFDNLCFITYAIRADRAEALAARLASVEGVEASID